MATELVDRLGRPLALGGEQSLLRGGATPWANGFWSTGRQQLDIRRTDYSTARELYQNTLPTHVLGGGFAKPIVDSKAGFTGRPSFEHDDEDVQDLLEHMAERWAAPLFLLTRNCFRDGDAYARLELAPHPLWPSGPQVLTLRMPPPEWVWPVYSPISGALEQVTIIHPVWDMPEYGETGFLRPTGSVAYTLEETLTRDWRRVRAKGARRPVPQDVMDTFGDLEEPNRWGFVPVVHYRNEPEEFAVYGTSELESVEPIMAAYHQVMSHAVRGNRLFSYPRVKFVVDNVDSFMVRNFGPNWNQSGQPPEFSDKDVYVMAVGEDAQLMAANVDSSGTTSLLHNLYRGIVESSEVPEFIMGGAIASSRASVQEQLLPFEKVIGRKRLQLDGPHEELATMYALMAGRAGLVESDGRRVRVSEEQILGEDHHVECIWPEISPKDEAALARTIAELVRAFSEGVQGGLVSAESAADFLKTFITTMDEWSDPDAEEDEQRKIVEGLRFIEQAQSGGPPAAGGAARASATPGQAAVPNLPLVDYTQLLNRINGAARNGGGLARGNGG